MKTGFSTTVNISVGIISQSHILHLEGKRMTQVTAATDSLIHSTAAVYSMLSHLDMTANSPPNVINKADTFDDNKLKVSQA